MHIFTNLHTPGGTPAAYLFFHYLCTVFHWQNQLWKQDSHTKALSPSPQATLLAHWAAATFKCWPLRPCSHSWKMQPCLPWLRILPTAKAPWEASSRLHTSAPQDWVTRSPPRPNLLKSKGASSSSRSLPATTTDSSARANTFASSSPRINSCRKSSDLNPSFGFWRNRHQKTEQTPSVPHITSA